MLRLVVPSPLLLVYLSGLWSAGRLLGAPIRTLAVPHLRGAVVTALAAGPAALLSSLGGEESSARGWPPMRQPVSTSAPRWRS